MEKISIKVGPPVEGNDFFGREGELRKAWENYILKGTSLKLSAPRRVGKSSFSKKLLEKAEKNGWKTLYLDLSATTTESEFVRDFKEKWQKEKWWENIKSKTGDAILNLFDSIKELEVAGNKVSINTSVWRSDSYGKIRKLIANTENILIVIDELTIYLNHLLVQENGKEKVEFFLEWLRKFRQTTTSCWVLCSSIGIDNFASMHQLNKHFNDTYPFQLGAFSEEEAKDFIFRLDVDENARFTEELVQYTLEKLGWYLPFFIQILADQVRNLIYEGKQLSKETIDEAYNLLIRGSYFNTWDERLEDYKELENNARKILKLCATSIGRNRDEMLASFSSERRQNSKNAISILRMTEPVNAETNLAKVLNMLQNDGYLVEHNGKYIFRSPLLRDFWYNRFIR